jgi:protein AATF/BFR2
MLFLYILLLQNLTSQINTILQDKDKLRKKAQLKRTPFTVFGKSNQQQVQRSEHDAHLNDYDEEIYDDSDFYQQLLKEVIESGSADIDPLTYAKYLAESSKLRKKAKKQMDKKATKNKKLE